MNTILFRLKSSRGETLVESMIAILIFTFASILFLTLVTSAADINLSVKSADESFQSQQQHIELGSDASVPAAQAVLYADADKDGEWEPEEVLVTKSMILVAADEEDSLYAYEIYEGGSGAE